MNDQTPAIYHHLVQCEVTPFFYAAPWFLTVFASQYPIAFTARVLGTWGEGRGGGRVGRGGEETAAGQCVSAV